MKRILTMQDISCVGKCSLGVAMPILSVMGLETCVLPTAVLSGHTAFRSPVKTDLTADIPKIEAAWAREGILFDGIESGYLGSVEQIRMVQDLWDRFARERCLKVCDPAMGDHGKLYRGFDRAYVEEMKKLCRKADVILPNCTELCLLTDTPCREHLGEDEIRELLRQLCVAGTGCVIMTGYGERPDRVGAAVYQTAGEDGGTFFTCSGKKLEGSYYGTGDIFAAVVAGALLRERTVQEAVRLAVDFTEESIRRTLADPDRRWYGTDFEAALPWLAAKMQRGAEADVPREDAAAHL